MSSRIAGLVSDAPASLALRAVGGLLDRIGRAGDATAALGLSGTTLGWTGIGLRGLARRGPLALALDGTLYDREAHGRPELDDAGLLLELVERHGIAGALARVNGDFAVAVWDADERTLWLARDRVGIRPLYWARTPDGIAFASRPLALAALDGVGLDPDPRFLAVFAGSHYRLFDNAPERSPFARVSQVPAATVVRLHEGQAVATRWWSPAGHEDVHEDDETLARRYRELLLDAVAIRVRAAERPAFTLSGGMDSSSVLGCAVQSVGRRQHAFSTVYEDATYDESAEIASMLPLLDEWHRVPIGTPDVLGLVDELVAAHDEPVATATWLSHHLLCRQVAREGFTTLLGGLGGDELNAGEYEYFPFHFADLRARGREAELAHEVERWAAHHDHPIHRKGPAQAEAMLARLTDPARPGVCLPDEARFTRYASLVRPELADPLLFVPVMEHPFADCLRNRAWQDLSRETLPCCLRAEDRDAAALGLGHALPFLDHRLIELMFRVPGDRKIADGVTKRLLREAMRGILPEETRSRVKKTGWNAPAHVWFGGDGAEAVLDLVHSQAFREHGVYDPAAAERMVREHAAIVRSGEARESHMMAIWQLVNLEAWLSLLDRERATARPALAA